MSDRMRTRLNVNEERENSRPARGGHSLAPRLRPAAILVALASLLVLSGCRPSGEALVPVAGKITYGGGPWPCGGMLFFTPAKSADAVTVRPGWARFAVDGTFHATSFKEGDGLFPGRYRVAVQCWPQSAASGEAPEQAVSPVDAKYSSPETSGLEVEVKPGQRSVTVELDVPKPAG
jgi:hypothetical protein